MSWIDDVIRFWFDELRPEGLVERRPVGRRARPRSIRPAPRGARDGPARCDGARRAGTSRRRDRARPVPAEPASPIGARLRDRSARAGHRTRCDRSRPRRIADGAGAPVPLHAAAGMPRTRRCNGGRCRCSRGCRTRAPSGPRRRIATRSSDSGRFPYRNDALGRVSTPEERRVPRREARDRSDPRPAQAQIARPKNSGPNESALGATTFRPSASQRREAWSGDQATAFVARRLRDRRPHDQRERRRAAAASTARGRGT